MASDQIQGRPPATFIYNFPGRPRRRTAAGLLLTSHHVLVTAWAGVLLATALVVPRLGWDLLQPVEAAKLCVRTTETVNYLGGVAGAALLGLTVMLYFRRLRRPRVLMYQMGLLLLMVFILVACQVFLAERMISQLRIVSLGGEGSMEALASLPDLQVGIQVLHGVALAVTIVTLVIGWRPRRLFRGASRQAVILSLPEDGQRRSL
ncbi:MAG: hypothetical protein GF355_05025 [Candidatus Eisenbacteria bacterium]|nr:hypothetical protein [Candidatus Eisenbacteria bacterium]